MQDNLTPVLVSAQVASNFPSSQMKAVVLGKKGQKTIVSTEQEYDK